MYEINIDNDDKIVCDSLKGSITCAITLFAMGHAVNIVSAVTGEIVFIVNKKQVYVADCIKMVL